ncbi:four-carbon acid sugar kinase family protein [Telluribacter sp. SYSU D00476]|uniref:four-carbon acid sugar kinase family protein n=1 Tax=Telluribacter sp. SYSU D00476 TaxID=2811430 RepID=UPI001FF4228E|nr:four-carbon acid sugar kinase family protein [Telluribacter sp. SYSU D00476]
MSTISTDLLDQLPPEYGQDLLPEIHAEFKQAGKTLVVLDDDPTGTQTSYDITVLTQWSVPLLVEELRKKPAVLFILTNSRSMAEAAAVQLTEEICRHLKEAIEICGQQIITISRSDSTLRGHFPAEVDAMARVLGQTDAIRIIVPAFVEGGRYTIEDIHYIKEQDELVPVSQTPFARDAVFGYRHSNLREWVEEKTGGRVKAGEVVSVSLKDIRLGGPQRVSEKLLACQPGQVCIVNATSNRDLEVFIRGVQMAEQAGQTCIYRTSATFVPIRAGMAPGKAYVPQLDSATSSSNSLIVVGSYVPKTTSQLQYLLDQGSHRSIEVDVSKLLHLSTEEIASYHQAIVQQADQWLSEGADVVIHTSRQLEVGQDVESNLKINSQVSEFLVGVVQGMTVRPSFMIAKGGITSSDLATKGLGVQKATVLGQIIPGVPVWKLDPHSKYPDLIYVVFPGNVGDDKALTNVYLQLKTSKN